PIPSSRCAFALLVSIAQVPIRAIPAGLNLLAAVDGRSIACQYFVGRDQKDTALCADSHFGFVPVRLIAPCLHECGHSAIIRMAITRFPMRKRELESQLLTHIARA